MARRGKADSAEAPVVRLGRAVDREAVARLFADSERLHARLHPGYFRAEGRLDARLADALEGPARERAIYVVALESAVVGFVHVELLQPKPRQAIGTRGHIDTIVVDPTARRRGCGRALVDHAAAWARDRGAVELLLTVWAGNDEAERFYERIGLAPVSRTLKLAL